MKGAMSVKVSACWKERRHWPLAMPGPGPSLVWRTGAADRDPQEARSCFSQAILADPDYAWAHSCLGDLLMEQGAARADIVSSYLNATEADPDESWNWLQLGRAYEMEPQDYKSALQAYELYFERAYDKQAALIHPLSISLIHLKDMEKALFWSSMLDEENCDDPVLLIMAGRVRRLAEGDMEAAEALFRKALLLSPEEHYGWHELGELKLFDMGDAESAAECLKTAFEI